MTESRFQPGTAVLLRDVWLDQVWAVRSAIVVADSEDLLALYVPHGGACKWPRTLAGERPRLPVKEWQFTDALWFGNMLAITRPGDAYSAQLFWTALWQLASWYINIQEPIRRSPLGFDTMDLTLDIVAAPDLSWWRWKDEEDLAEGVRIGLWSRENAAAIKAAGEVAVERLLARDPPYDRRWEDWRPPADWVAPKIPDGWDNLE